MRQLPTPAAPGCHRSTSWFYESGYSRYLFISAIMQCGFFHLVKCLQDPAVFGMLQNTLPFQGWIIFHCMRVGGVVHFQSHCVPLSLTLKTCPVTESGKPGARVVVHTFHLACHTFLAFSFPPPVPRPLLSPLFLPLFLSFSLYLSFFLLSSFLSPSPSILPFFPSFQSFLSQVGWGEDLKISLSS